MVDFFFLNTNKLFLLSHQMLLFFIFFLNKSNSFQAILDLISEALFLLSKFSNLLTIKRELFLLKLKFHSALILCTLILLVLLENIFLKFFGFFLALLKTRV